MTSPHLTENNRIEATGTVEKLVSGGSGLLHHPLFGICFVPQVLPGELVRFQIKRPAKNCRSHHHAHLLEVLRPAPQRVQPRCVHYGECGGCDWQHIHYSAQLELKAEIVLENLERLGSERKAENAKQVPQDYRALMRPPIRESADSNAVTNHDSEAGWGYRQRARFFYQAEAGKPVGKPSFRKRESRELVEVPHCLILHPRIQADLTTESLVENIPLAKHKEAEVGELYVFVDAEGCHYYCEWQEAGGEQAEFCYRWGAALPHLPEAVKLHSHAGLFFQSNAKVLPLLLTELRNNLGPLLRRLRGAFVDLYAGVGLLSQCFAPFLSDLRADGVAVPRFAVDRSSRAFDYLKKNLAGKGFQCHLADVGTFLKKILGQNPAILQGAFVVADPSRNGLSSSAARNLNRCGANYILYLSCDAASFARDIGRLASGYQIEYWQLVDFYPQTHHIEVLALLRSRSQEAMPDLTRQI